MNARIHGSGWARHFHRIAWLAVGLALCVIVFGAFVRLSHAGLSCPDWPTCYGRATWPKAVGDVTDHVASSIRQFDGNRAWREQVHRHLAATLGVLVLILALLGARRRPRGIAQVLGAALLVGIAIPMYMHGEHVIASILALAGEAILLAAAWRWSNTDLARVSVLTLAVIIFQALLGMWTVTWLLKPIVVMGHLLGGMTTLGLLAWMAWRATDSPLRAVDEHSLRMWLRVGLGVLMVQIALGGWVSANYAALACGVQFPKCLGEWWPPHDFGEALVLWRGIGVDYEGGVLDASARTAIQMMHRIFACVVLVYMATLVMRLLRVPGMRGWALLLGALTLGQLGLGIANVLMGLPLKVAVLHNAGAAMLLLVLVTLLARLAPLAQER
ncbi:COX15/CtaA family protein [Solilutibacter tolerans]|uniref:Cytochrome c oxidase assembly protein subunit 15 n=1 Tax=Solilutibacter tolerans TaxID=1604334 RepID=A0A1N6QUA9_9GAMM|nr:COX15/CtaA family protein [Lysobacter tolerans]SIQ20102.1 cytochrome c oxidase assembly protein subunit 15 [Lysobacter tolerans]